MAGQEKWYFSRDQLQNSPSRKCGLDADKELAYRQQAANLIQDMGQRLQVAQLCINTAIVYMHRFYAFHSFTQFHRNAIAAAALFLAAKVEEQPRKLEYVIKVAHVCLHRGESASALTTEQYQEQAQDLVFNENVLLQTLGFDVAIDHPHTHVVRTCHLVKAPKDLAQTSYFMASNSLHLTTMCLQYRPTVVACLCIHLASKWSNWAIPQSNEGRSWFSYVDRSVTADLLERLTSEFLHIFDKCPSRLKRKMMTMSNNSGGSPHSGLAPHSPFTKANKPQANSAAPPPQQAVDDFDKAFDREYEREKRRPVVPGGYVPAAPTSASTSTSSTQKIDYNVYREKKEREERERRQQQMQQQPQQQSTRAPPGQPPQPRPNPSSNHHQRPSSSQHHQKPHHSWPHHNKPTHHRPHEKPHDKSHEKPPHDHRHRPQPPTQPSSHQPPSTQQVPPQPHEPQRTRPPSLFSPENATTPTAAAAAAPRRPHPPPQSQKRPQQFPIVPQQEVPQRPPSPNRKRPTEVTSAVREMQVPAILSPFSSPPPKETPKSRPRLQSNSEPELVPVVKKLDETPGYENVLRDSQRGTIKTNSKHQEMRRPEVPPRSLNGIETDPTLVSNLLKESLAKPTPITVQTDKKSPVIEREVKPELEQNPVKVKPEPVEVPRIVQPPQPDPQQSALNSQLPPPSNKVEEHRHKKEKKKKEKHKHKDRDKSKEERKKHKKDKDRDKKKEASPPSQPQDNESLKITIPRDKLSLSPGLKIKIPKERLAAPPPPPQSSGIKIKISKEVLETSRKRTAAPETGPPHKMPRQNGSSNHHKVGNWNNVPQYPLPYYMVQPPPFYYGMGGMGNMGNMGMQEYFFPMYPMNGPPVPAMPSMPPLPSMPPPAVPPPPPE